MIFPPYRAVPFKPLIEAREAFEDDYVRQAIEAAAGSTTRAAALLGISRKHLWHLRKRAKAKNKRSKKHHG